MLCIHVNMKFTGEPLKRTAIELVMDHDNRRIGPVHTDRVGQACFDLEPASGKVLVAGMTRYQGRLDGLIRIELFSLTESERAAEGAASSNTRGSNAYPGMSTQLIQVGDHSVLTDSEGYLVDPDDWSEAFARQLATKERLELNSEHWEIIRFERDWYERYATQATVRDLIREFKPLWGKERANNRYLHQLFPRGGPQKQGNRLAGLLRPKGEV